MESAKSNPGSAGLPALFGADAPAEWASLPTEARHRLGRLTRASPLYAGLLLRSPTRALWLEETRNLRADYAYQTFADDWHAFSGASVTGDVDDEALLDLLREWRRLMSLRIAYRSVNELAPESSTVAELTRLAEFCIRTCLWLARRRCSQRYGEPFDDDLKRPARFCIIALGKLGGQELNFSSDVDLLFLYEGEGDCRRDGQRTSFTTVEFFTRMAGSVITMLGSSTRAGFLFRVDARLRPEGDAGPLVRSLSSLENYYAIAGQTWERLAWLKARPIAGDLNLGFELLESLQSFRYPRHSPPSLLAEVSGMKLRTERELLGREELDRDVKSGRGGIREIEFLVQAFQLLHAGRYPFLQTHSTHDALGQLARYGLLETSEAERLQHAYWFLRHLEHRIQMREERQTHALPRDTASLDAIASSMGFDASRALMLRLDAVRCEVHASYDRLFSEAPGTDQEFEDWWRFFTTRDLPPTVRTKLAQWLGDAPDGANEFRTFVVGGVERLVTREHVTRFQHLARTFDSLMPELARPLLTLKRLSRFAERYATPSHFFGACASNPQFLRVLALLFDRSAFIHELLCAHPDVFEEVIRPEVLRKRKEPASLAQELERGPKDPGLHRDWLQLYVRAEQVRYAIAELLGFSDVQETERSLSDLADAVLLLLAGVFPGLERILIVALGKYGGRELTFGSDLDLLFVAAPGEEVAVLESPLRSWIREVQGRPGAGKLFSVDPRLRPHGESGPLLPTLETLHAYHRAGAQRWEKQLLLRARVISGPAALVEQWNRWRDELLFRDDEGPGLRDELWSMRLRIEKERNAADPPWRSFKTGPGGLVDLEFYCQYQQLRHGHRHPSLRTPSTRLALEAIGSNRLLDDSSHQRLLENYGFLNRLELVLRRDENKALAVVPEEMGHVAHWMGFPEVDRFTHALANCMSTTRAIVHRAIFSEPEIVGT